MPARRIVIVVGVWAVALGLARLVALPERCLEVSVGEARAAAEATVGWFERNQLDGGQWTYGYNRDTDFVDRQPHDVRHSGVTLSLYQADTAGIPGAREVADEGTVWAFGQLVRDGDRALMGTGRQVPVGATALLVAALAERRATTGDPRFDDELEAMGRFLESVVEPSGAVPALWDAERGRPVPEVYSAFFTGETYFALASLAAVDPDGGWDETAGRIGRYISTERDRAEDWFPPLSDHWAAYGMATSVLDAGQGLGADERAYAHRLAGIFGLQVRYESQRTGDGLNRWVLRGPEALGGGLGTLGEGLGSLWRLVEIGELAEDRERIGERLRCVAGMLVERQADAAEAAETTRPELAEGAWFRLGYTQKDDQQHALSALLLAMPALADSDRTGGPTGDAGAGRVVLLLVLAAALVNPIRARRVVGAPPGDDAASSPEPADEALASSRQPAPGPGETQPGGAAMAAASPRARPATPRAVGLAGAALGGAVLLVLALAGGGLLRALDVSAPTALIAAGIVAGLSAIVDLVRPFSGPLPETSARAAPLAFAAVVLVRPAVALLVLSLAADVGIPLAVGLALAATAASLTALWPPGTARTPWETLAARAVTAVAIVGAVDLIVDGVFAI